uniref:Peptidase S74 domain-containing protein n=1 Tax=Heterorhabditis bacteriophora TaxID=37862 RepID=A0A1I7X913_HETBA
MPESSKYVDSSGLEVNKFIGVWPFTEQPIRIWAGTIMLNCGNLETPITYKLRCKCEQRFVPYWKCRNGSGTVTGGELCTIGIKLAEEAIYTSRLTLLVNNNPIELQLYKLPNADEYFWGIDTSNEQHKPWQQPNRVMDVLVDLGDFAKRERKRDHKDILANGGLEEYSGNDLVELVLIRLTEKLRIEQKRRDAQKTVLEMN